MLVLVRMLVLLSDEEKLLELDDQIAHRVHVHHRLRRGANRGGGTPQWSGGGVIERSSDRLSSQVRVTVKRTHCLVEDGAGSSPEGWRPTA